MLRAQAKAQAEQFAKKLTVASGSSLRITVEGAENKDFTTNVFVEVLQEKGYAVTLAEQNADATLEVFVLTQTVAYDTAGDGGWNRTTKTTLEARVRTGKNERVEFLGNLSHSQTDRVSEKEEGWWVSNDRALFSDVPPTALERIMVPVAVITATVILVYLFFTVRN
ncbi:MAG TPA: hypothetical protein VII11_03910 [Bacteroidota bacterium]